MRYRGFNIEHQTYYSPKGTVMCLSVYDGNDDLRRHSLLEIDDLEIDDPNSIHKLMMDLVDDHYDEIVSNMLYFKNQRHKELLGRAVTWLGEFDQGESLYNTLSEFIGLTDDEIRSIGFTSLVPYFDKKGYAQTIAEFIADYGTNDTMSGSYAFSFEEINCRFGTNLPEDEEMLDLIMKSFDDEVVSSCDLDDNGFDLTFYTDYCPNYYDDYSQNWGF